MVQHIQITPYLAYGHCKPNSNARNALWKSTMNEHFGFKVKGLIGWVQI
jgi:hypothetical protein